jgi:ABC-type amino acid transport substrate-binding protein
MKLIYFIISLLICSSLEAQDNFSFAVNSPGARPYLYYNSVLKKYDGVIVDILNQTKADYGIETRYIDSHRTRIESAINAGIVDGILSSSSWLKSPESLLSSIKVHQHNSFFYKLGKFDDNFNIELVKSTTICTRKGYIYPSITDLLKNKSLIRFDVSSQELMLKMLLKNRCKLVIMNEHNATAILNQPSYLNTDIFSSPHPSDSVKVSIFLGPKLHTIKAMIDSTITKMNKKGLIEASIKRHNSRNQSG